MEGETLVVRVVGGQIREEGTFHEAADDHAVEANFRSAGRALTADVVPQIR